MNIICVDFDGTCCDHVFPHIGQEAPNAIHWLQQFNAHDIKIILHTMRSDKQQSGDVLTQAVDWLESRGVKLWGINKNPGQHTWTDSPKPYGQLYIDDAAFGCPLWQPQNFSRPCVNWDIVGPGVLASFLK